MDNKQGMKYEITPTKPINSKRAALKLASALPTHSLVWLLVKRHKVFLLALGNVILVLNWAIPSWTEMVKYVLSTAF